MEYVMHPVAAAEIVFQWFCVLPVMIYCTLEN